MSPPDRYPECSDPPGEPDPASALYLEHDCELYAALQAADFAGTGWEVFRVEAIRYVLAVLEGWSLKRTLAAQLSNKGIAFRLTREESHCLATDVDFRSSVTEPATVEALEKFAAKGRKGQGWDARGGTALTTYLTGAALFELVNQIKLRREQGSRYDRAFRESSTALRIDLQDPHTLYAPDPEQLAVERDVLREWFGPLDAIDRHIVYSRAMKMSHREIAQSYNAARVDERAVARRWLALKKKYDWIRRLDEEAYR